MNRIEAHVSNAFKSIPDGERKTQLTREIIQDMQEMVSDFMAEGKSEEDAVNKAIVEFGEIDDLKAELTPHETGRNTPMDWVSRIPWPAASSSSCWWCSSTFTTRRRSSGASTRSSRFCGGR